MHLIIESDLLERLELSFGTLSLSLSHYRTSIGKKKFRVLVLRPIYYTTGREEKQNLIVRVVMVAQGTY